MGFALFIGSMLQSLNRPQDLWLVITHDDFVPDHGDRYGHDVCNPFKLLTVLFVDENIAFFPLDSFLRKEAPFKRASGSKRNDVHDDRWLIQAAYLLPSICVFLLYPCWYWRKRAWQHVPKLRDYFCKGVDESV